MKKGSERAYVSQATRNCVLTAPDKRREAQHANEEAQLWSLLATLALMKLQHEPLQHRLGGPEGPPRASLPTLLKAAAGVQPPRALLVLNDLPFFSFQHRVFFSFFFFQSRKGS